MKTFTIDPTAFLIETLHLSAAEIGAYVLLMVANAAREKNISEQEIPYITRMPGAHSGALESVMALFEADGNGRWQHPDIAEQIDERDRLAEFNTNRAKAGAAARHGKRIGTNKELDAAFDVLLPKDGPASVGPTRSLPDLDVGDGSTPPKAAAPVAQRSEPAAHNGEVAGSNPAGRTTTILGENLIVSDGETAVVADLGHRPSIGSPLPPDFALSGTMISEAKVKGVDDMGLLAEIFDEFKRYHINAGTVHPDWYASWDKWFERKRPKKPRAAPRVVLNRRPGPISDQLAESADD